jgi:GntR family colanic acid and biofilm gene transcriptional regulator
MNPSENLGTIERGETVTIQTYRRLTHALMTGTLKPGEKITGRRIAGALNVSLTPAREAISRLVAEGGLEPCPNRAALVPKLNKTKYREIISIRIMLEGLAAETAISNFDADRLTEIEKIQQQMKEATDKKDHLARMQKNAEFHFLIYRTANLPTLFSIIDSLWLQAGPTLSLLAPGYQKSRQGSRNHLNAIESIRQGSGKLLRKAIEKDLKDGTNYIMPLLDDI